MFSVAPVHHTNHQGLTPPLLEQAEDSGLFFEETEESVSCPQTPVVSLIIEGRFDEAVISARKMENVIERDVNLEAICMRLLRAGGSKEEKSANVQEAVRIAQTYISLKSFQQGLDFWIFKAFVECGEMDRALEILWNMSVRGEDSSVLRPACRSWIQQVKDTGSSANMDRFVDVVEEFDKKVPDQKLKKALFRSVLEVSIRHLDARGVLRILQSDVDTKLKIQTLTAVSSGVETPEEVASFCNIATTIPDQEQKQALISQLGGFLVERNHIDGFLALKEQLPMRDIILAINIFIQRKDVMTVLRIAGPFRDKTVISRSLFSISAYVETDVEVAEFCKVAENLDLFGQEKALLQLVGALLTKEDVDRFLIVVNEVLSLEVRKRLFSSAMSIFTKAGNLSAISKIQEARAELIFS